MTNKIELGEHNAYCKKHSIDGDYLLDSPITAKCFEMNKGGENV